MSAARELVDPRRYRLPPGMRLKVDSMGVEIFYETKDPWRDGQPTTLHVNRFFMVPEGMSEEHAQAIIDDQVIRAVMETWGHELAEWFQVDGKHVVDPHPDGRFSFDALKVAKRIEPTPLASGPSREDDSRHPRRAPLRRRAHRDRSGSQVALPS